jgi:mono/diheme cytochrome c family protein
MVPATAVVIASVASPERAAKLKAVSEFYKANCFSCHGMDGIGTLVRPLMPTIPDLASRQWQVSRTDGQVKTSILEGKGTLMPPYAGKVATELIPELVSFVRGFGPPDLLTKGSKRAAPATGADDKLRALRAQFDQVEKELRELKPSPAKP